MDFLPYIFNNATSQAIETHVEVPKEMDLFWRCEAQFLPEGKTWDELPEGEKKILRDKYRFDYLKPGVYQGISGIGRATH